MDSLNLNQQPIPQAPVSPDATSSIPEVPQTEMSQEQMRANLQGLMSKIENKYQDFNSQKFASNNKLQEQEGATLRQIFDLFESVGVDPSNVEDVRAFLDKIKANNPELYQQLETLLSSILGEENIPPTGEETIQPTREDIPAMGEEANIPISAGEEPIMGNMNINEGSQQAI